MEYLYDEINKYGKVRSDEAMSKHTTIQIGGPVDYFMFVETEEDLVNLLQVLDGDGVGYFIFGRGGNVLVSDQGYKGIAIKYEDNEMKIEDNKLIVDAGADIVKTAQYAMRNNLTGLEFGIGTRGSIGGVVCHNDIILDTEVSDLIHSLKIYKDGEVLDYSKEECRFDHDDFILDQPGVVLLEVVFDLEKSEENDSGEKTMKYIHYKNNNLPLSHPYIGPIFKKIPKEKVNLDWFSEEVKETFEKKDMIQPEKVIQLTNLIEQEVNGAKLAETQNYIINEEMAKPNDIYRLIENIEQSVYDEYEIELKREVRVLGSFY